MVKFRTTGFLLGEGGEQDSDVVDLIVDTDDVLVAAGVASHEGETCLSLKVREVDIIIKMDFNAYSAIALAGVEHLSTYGKIAG